jgi:hypothetical protein
MRRRRERAVQEPPTPVYERQLVELIQRASPTDHRPRVRTPVDVLRHYAPAVVVLGALPSDLAYGLLFHQILNVRDLFALPLGVLLGMTVAWICVYASALGLLDLDETS